LESAIPAPELLKFYKNFFTMQNWSLMDESSQDSFYNLEFRQSNKSVRITISVSPTDKSQNGVIPPVLINVQETF
jgi:4-hydroxyphenylpyruvate dioxygenase-like putative hemolysin